LDAVSTPNLESVARCLTTGELKELFKPTLGMYQAKKIAEQMNEITYEEAINSGFVLTGVVRVD